MPAHEELQQRYRQLEKFLDIKWEGTDKIATAALMAFDRQEPDSEQELVITTEELSSVCPWTGLPDQGTLTIAYSPDKLLIELKSLKYYLLSFRNVGITQEDAADRILKDLVAVAEPKSMTVELDYLPRGGIRTVASSHYP